MEEEPLVSINFHFRSNLSSCNVIQTFGCVQEHILDHRRVVASSCDPIVEEEYDGLVVLLLGVLQTVFLQVAKEIELRNTPRDLHHRYMSCIIMIFYIINVYQSDV